MKGKERTAGVWRQIKRGEAKKSKGKQMGKRKKRKKEKKKKRKKKKEETWTAKGVYVKLEVFLYSGTDSLKFY